MKTYKRYFLSEAYDFAPSSSTEIKSNKNIPADWHQFIIDLSNDKGLKDNIIFQTKWKKGDVRSDDLAIKIKPGRWAELKDGSLEIGSKFDVSIGNSTIKLIDNMVMIYIQYLLKLVLVLVQKNQVELNGNL